jgi:hypothetical protein
MNDGIIITSHGRHNYSAIHVQVNSFPKGVTIQAQNKTPDFNRSMSACPCIEQNIVSISVCGQIICVNSILKQHPCMSFLFIPEP